jgi:decaprenylphospho-beta-D-erythro-pentofuranosid-2-ulose 2-reductase
MNRVLIVGATSAIAIACAREWARSPSRFFLVGRNPSRLHQVADDLLARGAESAECQTLDLNDIDAHPSALEAAMSALGAADIVVIAHGTLPDQSACEQSVAATLEQIHTNAVSVVAFLTLLASHMELQKHGVIAVISSVAGDRGRRSNYVYGSAKAMVSTFCEGLRGRMHPFGVRVLTVKPGFVDTPMTAALDLPKLLVASPERVAKEIVKAVAAGKDILYTPWFWRPILAAIEAIPASVFKRLTL